MIKPGLTISGCRREGALLEVFVEDDGHLVQHSLLHGLERIRCQLVEGDSTPRVLVASHTVIAFIWAVFVFT